MAGQRAGPLEEDLNKNPFLCVLQKSFEGLYRRAVERGDATLVVPCAECLDGSSFDHVFVETHVLRAAPVPGCFINLCGQGVEVKDSSVHTDLGFAEKRICEVLQTESMYEFGNHFRVLITDRPLIGRFRTVLAAADRVGSGASGSKAAVPSPGPAGGAAAGGARAWRPEPAEDPGPSDQPLEWLDSAPDIQGSHFDEVARFRNTFVQVPGCEQSTAERIREIVDATAHKLIRHHRLEQPSQQRQLEYQVSRNTYAALHSWIWRHLQHILATPEERLEKGIRSFASAEELVEAIPGCQGRGLGLVDIKRCSDQLDEVDHKISPHEKIACIDEAYSALQRCVADGARQAGSGAVEITGDDVMSLFILAVYRSSLRQRLAHVAHVEMYLQGAAGLSGNVQVARFEEAGYAVSALQAALKFFLDECTEMPAAGWGQILACMAFCEVSQDQSAGTERRHGSARGGGRASAGGGTGRGGSGLIASYLEKPGPGDADGDADRAGMQLSSLVRQARAQGALGLGAEGVSRWRALPLRTAAVDDRSDT
eukprot:CAMPEP_0177303650 /NCGR_PEP_ID=MMETSP0368-20130122/6245_1 /TAXON_ID=447022 ORGANISM="Scrippsiella hangoei-like, Strain SHHI-4" /NCGR_SAMPLE_ID=MMETSP0368 /ASSEMBLY_ACC=CAM_ASM_000363 /LENGTH=539 /DNA_ID=CAMNT_0018762209 /DNA_START=128 /DNA_END=1747 /DNA_ORIENTATION=-